MLKSLEKLRGGHFGDRGISSSFHDAYVLANDIQAEVDEKYAPRDQAFPRPLFSDGTLVQYDDLVYEPGIKDECLPFEFHASEVTYLLNAPIMRVSDGESFAEYQIGERLKRPPEPDTQEKIDADYRNETNSLITDSGRGCMTRERALKYVERFDELMARQRKLDGVD